MRKILLIAALVAASFPATARTEVESARQTELLYLLKHDCGSCHGMTLKGGLGKPLGAELLAERTDEQLVLAILDGMPGTPMPPWRPLLTPEEAQFLVKTLRDHARTP